MILNVNLPTKKEDSIDLSEITSNYKGILIVFINNVCVGFIIYDTYDDAWKLYNNISLTDDYSILPTKYSNTSLIVIVNTLKNKYNTFSIKAIPFEVIKK